MHDANLWEGTSIGQFCEAWKTCALRIVWQCGIPMSPLDVSPLHGLQRRADSGGVELERVQSSARMCLERALELLKDR